MKITTRIVIDMTSGQVLDHEWHEYSGPIAQCKGGASKAEQKKADQMSAAQQALQNQYLGYANSILGLPVPGGMQSAFGAGTGQPTVLSTLQQIVANGGLMPAQQQAMQAGAINSIGQLYQNSLGQLQNIFAQKGLSGGQMAGGGGIGQNFGALQAALGNQMQNMNTQLWNQKMQSFNGALSGMMGLGQGLMGQGGAFGNTALGALGQGVTAAHNVDQAQMAPWNMLAGVAGGALGSFLNPLGAGFATNLMGRFGNNSGPQWVNSGNPNVIDPSVYSGPWTGMQGAPLPPGGIIGGGNGQQLPNLGWGLSPIGG